MGSSLYEGLGATHGPEQHTVDTVCVPVIMLVQKIIGSENFALQITFLVLCGRNFSKFSHNTVLPIFESCLNYK